MSDTESRDAYLAVSVLLPNKMPVNGRPVGFLAARKMIAKLEDFVAGAHSQEFDAVWQEFTALTGVTEDAVLAGCPDITLGEVIDLMQRFFYHRRPALTGTPDAAPAKGAP